jgi:hypothetical protein
VQAPRPLACRQPGHREYGSSLLHEFLSTHRAAILARTRAKVAARPTPRATEEELPVRHPALPRSAHRDPALLVRHVRRDRRERGSLRRDLAEERLLGRPGRPRLRRRLPGRHGARGRDERVDHAGRVPGSSTACLDDAIAQAVTEYTGQREQSLTDEGRERLGGLAHAAAHIDLRCRRPRPTPPSVPRSTPSPPTSPTPSSRPSVALPCRSSSPNPADIDVAQVALEARRPPRARPRLTRASAPARKPAGRLRRRTPEQIAKSLARGYRGKHQCFPGICERSGPRKAGGKAGQEGGRETGAKAGRSSTIRARRVHTPAGSTGGVWLHGPCRAAGGDQVDRL